MHTPVRKGLTTYDYIMREHEKDKEDSAAGVERGFHGRCACVRRKVSRILKQLTSSFTAVAARSEVVRLNSSVGLITGGAKKCARSALL